MKKLSSLALAAATLASFTDAKRLQTLTDEQAADLPWDSNSPESLSMKIESIEPPGSNAISGSSSGNTDPMAKAVSKASKATKSSKSMKDSRSLTGLYIGIDTEDGSIQEMRILCENKFCDIVLYDSAFSTCVQEVGPCPLFRRYGVGIANNVPEDSLDDFTLDLYCLEEGQVQIDYTKDATTTLIGDIELLPDNGIRRVGPEFSYSKKSVPQIKDETGKSISINNKAVNINGRYFGTDTSLGSPQILDTLCTKEKCDIRLSAASSSFSACTIKNSTGVYFSRGFGIARNVPRDSLDEFDFDVYCLAEDGLVVDIDDPSTSPTTTLAGNLDFLREGVLRRSSPGFVYIKFSDDTKAFSVYKDIAQKFYGTDTEDGSYQIMELTCKEGLCDISLSDSSFSTCAELYTGFGFPLAIGFALKKNVPQDSLHNFKLDLFCQKALGTSIDYTERAAELTGNLVFLQDGISKRTGPGFNYYNGLKGDVASQPNSLSIGNGWYEGPEPLLGTQINALKVTCVYGTCEVIYWMPVFPACVVQEPGQLPQIRSGVAINAAVLEESLGEDIDLPLYCVPQGEGAEIDYVNQDPTYTIKFRITPTSLAGVFGVASSEDMAFPEGRFFDVFKISTD